MPGRRRPLEAQHHKLAQARRVVSPCWGEQPAADPMDAGIEVRPAQDLVQTAAEGVRAVSPQVAGLDPEAGLLRFPLANRRTQLSE